MTRLDAVHAAQVAWLSWRAPLKSWPILPIVQLVEPLAFRGRSVAGAVALLIALAPPALPRQYSFHHYGTAEGLQNLVLLSLAQDPAGYIWAGTEGGLYRYDGTRFRLMGNR